ncbi:MAG: multicopper oxidase family protein [Acidimicrobiia bacterium]
MPIHPGDDVPDGAVTRRRFVQLTSVAAAAVGLGAWVRPFDDLGAVGHPRLSLPAQVADAGATVREFALVASPLELDLGGTTVATWGYGDRVPGPVIRLAAGEVLRVRFDNKLPESSTVHWHGIALPNAMDGVPDVTQAAVATNATFVYEFTVPDPGTYFLHSHVGVQLDRGLYAPLIVDDPADPGAYDAEWIVVLDDWTDGTGRSPDQVLANLESMGNMGGAGEGHGSDMGGMHGSDSSGMGSMSMAGSSKLLRGDAGDVRYPYYLVNGRRPKSPETFSAKPGQRLRLRIINAGSDTAFRVAVGGHRLTVTHTDGFPVTPTETDAVLLGMGERVDALVQLGDGAFPLVAAAEGKGAHALAVIRTGAGEAPGPKVHPKELDGRVLLPSTLAPSSDSAGVTVDPDRTHRLVLAGNHMRYRWTINGRTFENAKALPVSTGERVRLVFDNRSTMFHPMHLHGHTFRVMSRRNGSLEAGANKDTVIVRPDERVTVDFDADNPGKWVVHCHNAYHQAAGMMTTIAYQP